MQASRVKALSNFLHRHYSFVYIKTKSFYWAGTHNESLCMNSVLRTNNMHFLFYNHIYYFIAFIFSYVYSFYHNRLFSDLSYWFFYSTDFDGNPVSDTVEDFEYVLSLMHIFSVILVYF